MLLTTLLLAIPLVQVSGHSAFFHPSMYGFNVTDKTFDYDNRPVAPIKNMPFSKWWMHNHLDYPPNPGDIFEFPAGKAATAEIACNKGATSYFASSEGGDIRDNNNPCPNSPTQAYHTNGIDDLMGCAMAIAYKDDARAVKPEDFTIFSVNQTCVWTRFTEFQVPARMPPCPPGGCICSWFWIHSPKSGGEENYMNPFKCNITGSTSSVPLAPPKVARRCGRDLENGKAFNALANCTYGAKSPFYWFNLEGNNVFEGDHSPPVYNDLYNFLDGAQDDIFADSYLSIPEPSVTAALPVLADIGTKLPLPDLDFAALGLDLDLNSTAPLRKKRSLRGRHECPDKKTTTPSPSSPSSHSDEGASSSYSVSSPGIPDDLPKFDKRSFHMDNYLSFTGEGALPRLTRRNDHRNRQRMVW